MATSPVATSHGSIGRPEWISGARARQPRDAMPEVAVHGPGHLRDGWRPRRSAWPATPRSSVRAGRKGGVDLCAREHPLPAGQASYHVPQEVLEEASGLVVIAEVVRQDRQSELRRGPATLVAPVEGRGR